MIQLLFLLVVLASFWHFIYEGIVAPSIRARLRFDVFRLRDSLRIMASNNGADKRTFTHVHDLLNTAIQVIPVVSISAIAEARRAVHADQDLQRRISKRDAVLESANQEIRDLVDQACRVAYKALLVNSGGWYFYLVPLTAAYWPIRRICNAVDRLLMIPERDLEKAIAPSFAIAPT